MNVQDALRAQPKLAEEPGYKAWIENDDVEALNEALEKWGLGEMNAAGEIQEE